MARILVIEDDDSIRKLIEKFMLIDGHEVETAENGLIGLEMIGSRQYDLLITDIVMPEQDGIGVLMELRKMQSKLKTIVITGGSLKLNINDLMKMAKVMKADKVLMKPLDFENLRLTVAELLKEAEEAS